MPEPLRPTTLPDGPWQDVATDLLGPLPTGHSILVVVDYYSRYYEYDILKSTTAKEIINSLEDVYSRHGLPLTCRTDCGPQFMSEEFRLFCIENGIQHVKTTPKWAQANGEVERQNASLMKRIRIAQAEGLDWKRELRKYVMVYRAINHTTTGRSPAELLFGRKIRGKLPDLTTVQNDWETRDRDAEHKGKAKAYADERRRAKPSNVEVGDQVLLKQDKTDKFTTPFNKVPHTVINKTGNSVIVQSPTGARYSRNSTCVKKYISEDPTPPPEGASHLQGGENVSSTIETQKDLEPETCGREQVRSQLTSTPVRPQRQTKLPERLKDFVIK